MQQSLSRSFFLMISLLACSVVALTTGCASGGFKLTREYAGFVNRQNVVIRVILYILTGVVFFATILIDVVVNNTMDFWNGQVSQGTYEFHQGGKTYVARHEILPGTSLKRSTIRVYGEHRALIQDVVLQETTSGEIEMFVDGQLRARVHDLSSLPMVSVMDEKGQLVEEKPVLFEAPIRAATALARR